MAKGTSSSANKRRKKSNSVIFRTPKEKKQRTLKLKEGSSASTPSSSKIDKNVKSSTPVKTSRATQRDRRSESSSIASSKENISEVDEAQQNEKMKLKTQTKRKKRQSINFVTRKDKRPNIQHQSMTGHTITRRKDKVNASARSFNSSTSSISKLSDTPGQVNSRFGSTSNQSIKDSTRSPKTSKKRKLTSDHVQTTSGGQAKKRKTSKNPSPNKSFTSVTSSTRGRPKSKKSPGIPVALDRIRDLKVTKKSFEKWKPMSKVTIAFVEGILKSVILNVSAEANKANDEEGERCLATLKNKVMEKLPNLKAPYTKGDYRKMESENKSSEDIYLEKSREVNLLDKKTEEEQRLLDEQTAMVVELTKKFEKYEKELEAVEREKVHPLIQQTKNVLNLPELPDDFFIEEEVPAKKSVAEKNLCETLLDLRRNTKESGLEKWMDKLTVFTKKVHEVN